MNCYTSHCHRPPANQMDVFAPGGSTSMTIFSPEFRLEMHLYCSGTEKKETQKKGNVLSNKLVRRSREVKRKHRPKSFKLARLQKGKVTLITWKSYKLPFVVLNCCRKKTWPDILLFFSWQLAVAIFKSICSQLASQRYFSHWDHHVPKHPPLARCARGFWLDSPTPWEVPDDLSGTSVSGWPTGSRSIWSLTWPQQPVMRKK